MLRQTRFYLVLITLLALLLACSRPGTEYVGKWRNAKNPSEQLEIAPNGDNFLIRLPGRSLFGQEQTTTVPGVLKDGILETRTGLFGPTLTYVSDTGRLTAPGFLGGTVEYERVK